MRYQLPKDMIGTDGVSIQGENYPVDEKTGQFDAPDNVAPHVAHLRIRPLGAPAPKNVMAPQPAPIPAPVPAPAPLAPVKTPEEIEVEEAEHARQEAAERLVEVTAQVKAMGHDDLGLFLKSKDVDLNDYPSKAKRLAKALELIGAPAETPTE